MLPKAKAERPDVLVQREHSAQATLGFS